MRINENLLVGSLGKLLWENTNVTQSWPSARQITMNTSDYDFYEVIYFTSASNLIGMKSTGKIPKGKSTQCEFVYSNGVRRREFAYNDDTHYTVSANQGIDGDMTCRPLYVLGYKMFH